jgi:hypothetical protein
MIESALAGVVAVLCWFAWQGGGMLTELIGLDELWPLIQPLSVLATLSLVDWMMRRM